jgi:purine-cytosine permease-like protein
MSFVFILATLTLLPPQIITLALGMLGYKYVHIYEKWSWIPTAITFFVVLGCAAKHLVNVPMGT